MLINRIKEIFVSYQYFHHPCLRSQERDGDLALRCRSNVGQLDWSMPFRGDSIEHAGMLLVGLEHGAREQRITRPPTNGRYVKVTLPGVAPKLRGYRDAKELFGA